MSLTSIVENCTNALAAITPHTLTPEKLGSSLQILQGVDINDAIDEFWADLPPSPDQDNKLSAWKKDMHNKARDLNHHLTGFNHELSRVKEMQAALKIPQLDELIHAGQLVIRPIYNFTAQLNNQ